VSEFNKGQRVRVLPVEGVYVSETCIEGQVSVQTDYSPAVIRVPRSLLEPIAEPVKVGDEIEYHDASALPVGSIVRGVTNLKAYAVGTDEIVSLEGGARWDYLGGYFKVEHLGRA
jgi:hypothetical protein